MNEMLEERKNDKKKKKPKVLVTAAGRRKQLAEINRKVKQPPSRY